MMSKLLNMIVEITLDVLNNVMYFIKNNLIAFANLLDFVTPFGMFFVGQYVALDKGKFSVSSEIIIPLLVFVLIFYIRTIANKIGKGAVLPLPDKRFTQVDEDGEVSIEHNRVQELILYMADLEDWMERKGLL